MSKDATPTALDKVTPVYAPEVNHGVVSAAAAAYAPRTGDTKPSYSQSDQSEAALQKQLDNVFNDIYSALKNGGTDISAQLNSDAAALAKLLTPSSFQPPGGTGDTGTTKKFSDVPLNGETIAAMTANGRDNFPSLPKPLDQMEKNLPILNIKGNAQAEQVLSKYGTVATTNGVTTFDAGGKQIPPLNLNGVSDFVIKNAIVANTANTTSEAGIFIQGGSKNVTVENSRFENVGHGVQAMNASNIKVNNNYFGDMTGAAAQTSWYRSDPVQFNNVTGNDSSISNNIMNNGSASRTEDNINVGGSTFTKNSDGTGGLTIANNFISGASDSWHATGHQATNRPYNPTGTGVQIEGDSSGITIANNDVERQNNGGISVWSGHDVVVKDNTVNLSQPSLAGESWGQAWGAGAFGASTDSSNVSFENNTAILASSTALAAAKAKSQSAYGDSASGNGIVEKDNSWQTNA